MNSPSPEQHKAALAVASRAFAEKFPDHPPGYAIALEKAIAAYLSALPEQPGERPRMPSILHSLDHDARRDPVGVVAYFETVEQAEQFMAWIGQFAMAEGDAPPAGEGP